MANTHTTLNYLFTGIADAIRIKKNSTEFIVADNFPAEIENLRTGFDYNNSNVTSIPDYAFYGCEDLKSVDCYNLTSIGTSAFENCTNLKSVILYDGVATVGENAFKGCSSDLTIYCYFDSQPTTWYENWNPNNCKVVYLGGAVETWDVSATEEDDVVAKLYNNVKNSGMYTLIVSGSGNIKDYDTSNSNSSPWRQRPVDCCIIKNGITNISRSMLYKCTSLTSITIPDSVTSIGICAFQGCTSLTSITIPDGVTSIGSNTFRACTSLTSITIPDSVTSIGIYAFQDCTSLTSITIPDGLTSIGNNTFCGCAGLTSITIPNSVVSIGYRAFYYCRSLTSIIYTGTTTQWNAITFDSDWNIMTPDYTIHCTDGDIAKDGTITYH